MKRIICGIVAAALLASCATPPRTIGPSTELVSRAPRTDRIPSAPESQNRGGPQGAPTLLSNFIQLEIWFTQVGG
ncbi:membrane lipoprotein lipid attachment site-containing protein [Achromobacter kerstersii]|uniref:membrane lipoprotein lipid attachment site-containing protein n=1 Tax=Achromobacter kerstersii TaxID=1353890 RepID=UPI0015819F5A